MCVQLNWFTSCIKDRNAETNKILCCVTMVLMKHEVVKARSPHILKMAGNYRFEFVVVIMLCNVLNFFNNVSMFARAEDELCFSVIGDIGGLPRFPFQTTSQRKVAKLLAKVSEDKKLKFVVGLGDNFYFSGVRSVKDPRFYFTFERTYSAKSLDIPWYMIAGNHDHVSNVSAQIKYSQISDRWHFPDFYYTKVFQIPNSRNTLQLLMIDTTMLCWHNKRSNSPPPNTQLEWIENTLRKSSSSFLVVAGHHPVFSSGSHGNTECLVKLLKPLLEKYAVSAYFCGHDHNLQYVNEKNSDVHYFISGSGNFVDGNFHNKVKLPKDSTSWQQGDNGFITACASKEKLKLDVYMIDGETPINSTEIMPRHLDVNLNANVEAESMKNRPPTLKLLISQLYPVLNTVDVSTTSETAPAADLNKITSMKLKKFSNNHIENLNPNILTKSQNPDPNTIMKSQTFDPKDIPKSPNSNFKTKNLDLQQDSLNVMTFNFKTMKPGKLSTEPSQEISEMMRHYQTNTPSSSVTSKISKEKTSELIDVNTLSDIPLSSYGTLPLDSKLNDGSGSSSKNEGESDNGDDIIDLFLNKMMTTNESAPSSNVPQQHQLEQSTIMQTKLKDISAKKTNLHARKSYAHSKDSLKNKHNKLESSGNIRDKSVQNSMYLSSASNLVNTSVTTSSNVYNSVPYYYLYRQVPLYYTSIYNPIPSAFVIQPSVYNNYYWNKLKQTQ